MKKVLIIIGIILSVLLASIILIPVIFKEDIKNSIDRTLKENLNAKVYYHPDNFSISLLRGFPDFNVSIGNFGIIGINEFENDTLVAVNQFSLNLDLMSIISGDQIIINSVKLNSPNIKIQVLKNGIANYDIAKPSENVEEKIENENTNDISVAIENWVINDASLIYIDSSMNFSLGLKELNHQGTGDFSLTIFDLLTQTSVEEVTMAYEGIEYVSNKSLMASIKLNMDLDKMKFTFLDNSIVVNDFEMQANGSIEMLEDDIIMDINFGGKDINLTSVLSLIPGIYQEYLNDVKAEGNVEFDGKISGTFNENRMPQIKASLEVNKGSLKYASYDVPLEQIDISASFDYPSSDLSETSFEIKNFSLLLDEEPFSSKLYFKNFMDYQWDFGLDGNIDLEKLTKIVPLENIELKGKINSKLESSGKMSLITEEKYDKLATSGSISINDFLFKSSELPQGFEISKANLSFDPNSIVLNDFTSKSGTSDFNLKGSISNYIGFALNDQEILKGELIFESSFIDVSSFISETSSDSMNKNSDELDSTSLEVVRIPANIDFALKSSISSVRYNNLEMKGFNGNLLIKNGAIILENTGFNLLDANFGLSGIYNTYNLDDPEYEFGFSISELSIASAYESFETVKEYVPIAGNVSGVFSSEFITKGVLKSDMMPMMDKISLDGVVNITNASLTKGILIEELAKVSQLNNSNNDKQNNGITLKDVLIKTKIENGRLSVEPFNLKLSDQQAIVSGSSGLDGSLDYKMLIKDVKTGAIGKSLNAAISSFIGSNSAIPEMVDLNIGIGGDYKNPDIKLLGTSSSSNESTENKKSIQNELDNQKKKIEAQLADDRKKAEEKAKKKLEEEKLKAEEEAKRLIEEEKKKAEEKLKNLFKKKKGGG